MTQEASSPSGMRLGQFIKDRLEPILVEWEAFARSIPMGRAMSVYDLRDHAKEVLLTIAADLEKAQTKSQRDTKGKGHARPVSDLVTAASEHGVDRQVHGFDLNEMVSEYRALRASVLRLWKDEVAQVSGQAMEDIARFNEGIDQALAESIASYSAKMAEARETFMAILGHDLRSPLAALNNCLSLMNKSETSPSSRERTFQIGSRSIAHMDGLITDLLEYTRTRLGKGIEVVAEPGNLGALCRDAFEEARTAHPDHHLVYESVGNLTAAFDSARMDQVLTNLLNNAVQHGDPDSPISMDVREDGTCISVVVANRGVPIPENALQSIFDPLVQLSKPNPTAQKRRSAGMGLGLFIARQIVTAHGGTIDVSSSAERGTAFRVCLPKAASQPA